MISSILSKEFIIENCPYYNEIDYLISKSEKLRSSQLRNLLIQKYNFSSYDISKIIDRAELKELLKNYLINTINNRCNNYFLINLIFYFSLLIFFILFYIYFKQIKSYFKFSFEFIYNHFINLDKFFYFLKIIKFYKKNNLIYSFNFILILFLMLFSLIFSLITYYINISILLSYIVPYKYYNIRSYFFFGINFYVNAQMLSNLFNNSGGSSSSNNNQVKNFDFDFDEEFRSKTQSQFSNIGFNIGSFLTLSGLRWLSYLCEEGIARLLMKSEKFSKNYEKKLNKKREKEKQNEEHKKQQEKQEKKEKKKLVNFSQLFDPSYYESDNEEVNFVRFKQE